MVDAIILAIVAIVCALIIRAMVRGSVRTCDGACGGNCAKCGHVCSTPRLHLTEEQLAQLAEIDARGGRP